MMAAVLMARNRTQTATKTLAVASCDANTKHTLLSQTVKVQDVPIPFVEPSTPQSLSLSQQWAAPQTPLNTQASLSLSSTPNDARPAAVKKGTVIATTLSPTTTITPDSSTATAPSSTMTTSISQRSAYLQYFKRVIRYTLGPPPGLHSHLFTPQELRWQAAFEKLSSPAAGLFVRLFLRSSTWFRSSDVGLLNYRVIQGSPTVLLQAIKELTGAGFMIQLTKQTPNKECLSALQSTACLTAVCERVHQVLLAAGTKRRKFKMKQVEGRRQSRKAAMVADLATSLPRQKDVFGRSRNIAPTLLDTLHKSHKQRIVQLRKLRQQPGFEDGPRRVLVPNEIIFRLSQPRRTFFRRLEFLFNVGTASAADPYGMEGGGSYSTGGSAQQQPQRNALLELFGKLRFTPYQCASAAVTPIFHDREEFLQYEHACTGLSKLDMAMIDGRVTTDNNTQQSPPVSKKTRLTKRSPQHRTNNTVAEPGTGRRKTKDTDQLHEWPHFADSIVEVACASLKRYLAEYNNTSNNRFSGRPPYLRRFEAGSVMATIVWLGIDVVQKQQRYADAIHMLQLLLRSPYSRQRRGRWWIRLLIDLEHVRLTHQKAFLTGDVGGSAEMQNQNKLDSAISSWESDSDDEILGISDGSAKVTCAHQVDPYRLMLETDAKIARTVVAALDDMDRNNSVQLGQKMQGIVINAPDRTAIVYRAKAIRERLLRRYPRGRIGSIEDGLNIDTLVDMVRRVTQAIETSTKLGTPVDWSPPSVTIQGTPLNKKPGQKSRFMGYDGTTNVTVEELVLQYVTCLLVSSWRTNTTRTVHI